jgi:hypothetical protein
MWHDARIYGTRPNGNFDQFLDVANTNNLHYPVPDKSNKSFIQYRFFIPQEQGEIIGIAV